MTEPAMHPVETGTEDARTRATLADTQADLRRHAEALSRLQAQLMLVRREVSATRAENIHLRGVVARLEQGIANLEAESVHLHDAVARLTSALNAVYTSLSWRFSTPVRVVGRLVRKFKGSRQTP